MSSWQPIIGLEVHVELKTRSKMFCPCPNKHFGIEPNTYVCPVCLGLPGALPVPNQEAINQTIVIALAFNCQINRKSWFDRKNYFYPDLPKGYQISQHFSPIGINGRVPILVNGKVKEIGLSDIHLEEDTGKLIHQEKKTLIDFNRSGVPLVEIVSKPEIHSAKEAKAYLKRIQQTIRWLGFSDCDMEKGSMRLEANVSVLRLVSSRVNELTSLKLPSYKVEIKNLNSFRFVERAIEYEIQRQIKILEKGETPKQETRGFDPEKGITYSQRSKEVAKDYRYFPEPDIPPFEFSEAEIKKLAQTINSLPWEEEQKLIKQGVNWQWAEIIARTKERVALFWQAVERGQSKGVTSKEIANWLVNRSLPKNITPEALVELITKEKSRFSLGEEEIASVVEKVLQENPKAVKDYRKGKTQVIGFLIGQVQRKTRGKAEPNLTRKLIEQMLNE